MKHRLAMMFYGVLLRIYPTGFRERHGSDLTAAFLRSLEIQRMRLGILGTAYALLRVSWDTVTEAVTQRRAAKVDAQTGTPGNNLGFRSVVQDVRFTLRALLRNPGFTVVAVLTLAAGIGANTAVFSVVNTVLLRPLPYDDPEQLAVIWTSFGPDLPQNWVSGPEFVEMREFNTTFEDIGTTVFTTLSVTGDGEPVVVGAGGVSGNFFRVLRVSAALGRTFVPEDDTPDADRAVMISDGLWQRRFGSDPTTLGRTLVADGQSYTIVGVLPAGFNLLHPDLRMPDNVDLWIPITPVLGAEYGQMQRGSHFLRVVGRVRDGIPITQAKVDMDRVALAIQEKSPDYYDFDGWGLTVYSLHGDLVESVRPALLVLLGGVAFVLLIACANVANLQLVRATGREREIAVRTALGAGRSRLAQQFFTESLILSGLGAIFGLVGGFGLVKFLVVVAPDTLPRRGDIGVDVAVLLFTLSIAIITGLAFGMAPLFHGVRDSLVGSLKEGGHGTGTGASRGRLRDGLVIAEVALAIVLLIGAGLMIKSFSRLQTTDPGYNAENLLTMQISLPETRYDTEAEVRQFFDQLLERTASLPGVVSAGAITHLPLSGAYASGTTQVSSSETVPREEWAFEAERRWISPAYFETMGTSLVRGRFFSDLDNADGPWVAIVDEEFVSRFWPNENPIGKRIAIHRGDDGAPVWREIVGVVRHSRHYELSSVGREQAYYPYRQGSPNGMYLVVRSELDPTLLAATVRDEVWAIDPEQPVSDVRTMEELVQASVSQPKFNLLLLGSFSCAALLLAAVGIYGVISYSVSQRRQEIGVRMALGAARKDVLALVMRQGFRVAGIGLGIGVIGALLMTRLLENMLFEVSSLDVVTYVGVVLLLGSTAASACLLPAFRASRVHPVEALRQE